MTQRVSDDEFESLIGEGMHTGLRKGSEARSSAVLWQAISDSKDDAWSDAARFCVWGIGYSGFHLYKDKDIPDPVLVPANVAKLLSQVEVADLTDEEWAWVKTYLEAPSNG